MTSKIRPSLGCGVLHTTVGLRGVVRGKGLKTTASALVPSTLLAGPQTVKLDVLDLITPVPLSSLIRPLIRPKLSLAASPATSGVASNRQQQWPG
jgi:hypothetical protein